MKALGLTFTDESAELIAVIGLFASVTYLFHRNNAQPSRAEMEQALKTILPPRHHGEALTNSLDRLCGKQEICSTK